MDTPGVWGLSGEEKDVEPVSEEPILNCDGQGGDEHQPDRMIHRVNLI